MMERRLGTGVIDKTAAYRYATFSGKRQYRPREIISGNIPRESSRTVSSAAILFDVPSYRHCYCKAMVCRLWLCVRMHRLIGFYSRIEPPALRGASGVKRCNA